MTVSSDFPSTLWSQKGSYPLRPGNALEILVDGQAAYAAIAAAFQRAKTFIYSTISFADQDFLLVPESGATLFDIFRARQASGVDVRMVLWQPARQTPDTIPDPAPGKIPGVNEGTGSIQARWDVAKGYAGWYRSPQGLFEPFPMDFPAVLGCHHQKTYIMDDGEEGVVAFVGGINPVQAYWDTPAHDVLDARRVAQGEDALDGLQKTPPLHDIFYRITGPAVGDVLANFVERYNGASIRYPQVTTDVTAPVAAEQIPMTTEGTALQILRTIAPNTYPHTGSGDTGIREFYLNVLNAAGAGSLVYIENQYFFDRGIVAALNDAAGRGAKVIALLTSKPDEGTLTGQAESKLEEIAAYTLSRPDSDSQPNVLLLTLGNSRPDPRSAGHCISSETYIHSKTLAVIGADWAVMTGGSANIAFTSMWFHSEMNVACMDAGKIKQWVAQLWAEHLQISPEQSRSLVGASDDAFNFFAAQAARNKVALAQGQMPEGRVFDWSVQFPGRDLQGCL